MFSYWTDSEIGWLKEHYATEGVHVAHRALGRTVGAIRDQVWRLGLMVGKPAWWSKPIADRFWTKVNKTETCWLWTAGAGQDGYGHFSLGRSGKQRHAHIVAYEMLVGPIPKRLDLHHKCEVTACVNPDHLEPLTRKDHVRKGSSPASLNARKTHCKYGHEFTAANTQLRLTGGRSCKACHRRMQAVINKRNSKRRQ